MSSKQKQKIVRLTPAQKKAVDDAVKLSGMTTAQWLRLAVGVQCVSQGVTFPDDYPTHGGKRDNDSK